MQEALWAPHLPRTGHKGNFAKLNLIKNDLEVNPFSTLRLTSHSSRLTNICQNAPLFRAGPVEFP